MSKRESGRKAAVEKWVHDTLPCPDPPQSPEVAQDTPSPKDLEIEPESPTKTPPNTQSPLRGHLTFISDSEDSIPQSLSVTASQGARLGQTTPKPPKTPNVDISFALTDAQMDKLASAIASRNSISKDQPSPTQTGNTPLKQARSPVRRSTHRSGTTGGYRWYRDTLETMSNPRDSYKVSHPSSKPTSPNKMIKVHWDRREESESPALKPRKKTPPRAINTDGARHGGGGLKKYAGMTGKSDMLHPTHSNNGPSAYYCLDNSSSIYSDEHPLCISEVKPLYIPSIKRPAPDGSVLRSYTNYSDTAAEAHVGLTHKTLGRAKSFRDSRHKHGRPTSDDRGTIDTSIDPIDPIDPISPFSPFSPYFPPIAKKEKVMIGDHGWLEDTGDSKNVIVPVKKQGILESLKKKAKEMIVFNDNNVSRPPRGMDKDRRARQVLISLDPREQSLLYCELEFTLTSALNDYISAQFNEGRLDSMKLNRVTDRWASKGRPKVVAFRYDLETQLDIVAAHCNEFRFYGFRQGNSLQIMSVIDAMRNHARAMRVRSFCHPDLVIHKQVLDSRALGDTIGAGPHIRSTTDQICVFFSRIVDREKRKLEEHEQGNGNISLNRSHAQGCGPEENTWDDVSGQ